MTPVAHNHHLQVLPTRPLIQDEDLWTEVHHVVQKKFASLENDVRCQVLDVRTSASRTHGDGFYSPIELSLCLKET
jgi:hypothetical protein